MIIVTLLMAMTLLGAEADAERIANRLSSHSVWMPLTNDPLPAHIGVCMYDGRALRHMHVTRSWPGPRLSDSGEFVTIATLLSDPSHFHLETVTVRGTVTQPELHVDETGLFIDFVFVLRDGKDSIIVFGRHDRTQGNIQIVTDQRVEVTGKFWKDRTAQGFQFQNNIEAFTVMMYPPLSPDSA